MNYRTSLARKVISFVLIIIMFLTEMPTRIYAEIYMDSNSTAEEETLEESSGTPMEIMSEEEPRITIIDEIDTLRDETTKHFYMSDGSITAAVYNNQIHYENENGEYIEIDNSLISQQSSNGDIIYTNAANSYKVVLSQQANSPKMLEYTEGDNVISWSLIGLNSDIASNVQANITTEVETGEGDFAITQKTSTLQYNNIIDGVSLQYIPESDGIKENIVLSKVIDEYKLIFELKLQGVGARLTEDNTIELFDLYSTENVIYTMPAPYMFDLTGKESNQVFYQLMDVLPEELDLLNKETNEESEAGVDLEAQESESGDTETIESSVELNSASSSSEDTASEESAPPLSQAENTYYLIIQADSEWINASERAFPVVIDPVLKKYRTKKDYSYLGQFQTISKDRVDQTGNDLLVGIKNNYEYRSYMQFDLPKMQPGDQISDAKLTLTATKKGGIHDIYAYAPLSKWDESRITWANQPFYEDTYTDQRVVDFAAAKDGTISFSITKPIRKWYDAPETNNGLCFLIKIKTNDTYSTLQPIKSTSTPFLQIIYRSITGLESYWSTHTASAGDAGTGAVNDYSGLLTFIYQDMTTAGNRMPMSIEHIYNSKSTVLNNQWGNNWNINYAQTLRIPINEADLAIYPYVYTDADGTRHYLKKSDVEYFENGELVTQYQYDKAYPAAKDEDGLGLFVVPVTDATLKKSYPIKIVNKSGSINLYFDHAGRLGMIIDSNQKENASNSSKKERNRIQLTYENIPGAVMDFSNLESIIQEVDLLLSNVNKTDFLAQAQTVLHSINTFSLESPYLRIKYKAASNIQAAQTALEYLIDNSEKNVTTRKTYVTKAQTAVNEVLASTAGLNLLLPQRLYSIQDAVNNISYLEYNQNGKVISITDPTESNSKVHYIYDEDERLTAINDAKGRTVRYSYNEDDLLTSGQDSDGYRLEYTYSEGRVTEVSEYKGSQQGQAYTIDYGDDATTTYRFSGNDDILGTTDDLLNVYTFDKEGKTQSTYSKLVGQRDIIGAAAYTYVGGSSDAAKKIKESAVGGTSAVNLLKNHSFEYTDNWIKYSSCSLSDHSLAINTPSITYIGFRSASIKGDKATHTKESGYKQTVTLEPGQYTFSGYIKTSALTGNAFLCVKSEEDTFLSELITGTTAANMNSGWMRVSVTFSVGASSSVDACFATDGGTGEAWFDCLQLETGSVANPYNILENSSFEIGEASSTPYQWKYEQVSGTINGIVTTDENVHGSRSYKITGEPKATKTLSISPSIRGSESYVLSGWVKTNCAPLYGGRTCSLTLTYSNTSVSDANVTLITQPFNPSADGWTYFSVSLPMEQRSYMTIKFTYAYNVGDIYIDNLQLVKNEVQTRAYSSTGKVTSYSNKTATTSFAYNKYDLISKKTTPGGLTTSYYFDPTNNDVTGEYVYEGPENFYAYDKYGNVTRQILMESSMDNSPELCTRAAFTDDGNFQKSSTDTRGNTVGYEYDALKGLLLFQTDPVGQTTQYSYNEDDLVSSVSKADIADSYTYDSERRLSEIAHNGFRYSFEYDEWGNTLSVAAAGNNLVENEYAQGNGKLLRTSYANGYTTSPIYNEREQLVGNKRSGVTADKLIYNNAGHLVEYLDYLNSLRYNYDYDAQGRAVRQFVSQLDGGRLYQFQNIYDSAGRITAVSYGFGDERKNYYYAYASDDKVTKTTLPNLGAQIFSYDELRRPKGMTLVPVSGAAAAKQLNVALGYVAGVGSSTGKTGWTTLVQSYSNKLGTVEASKYTYAYDVIGNITSVTDKTGKKINYEYDVLGQLTRVNDESAGITSAYAYDQGGNLTQAVEYAYTADILGEAVKTHTYRYDETWKDLLIEYDGQTITYDAVGNPISYLGNTMTWEYGRQLAGISRGDAQIQYGYTPDGTRLSKAVNGQKTEYTLNGSTVLSETTGDETLYYYYSNGKLVEIGYKNGGAAEVYYFVTRNAQGDITAIYDAKTCTLVGSYTYDAWGRVLSATAVNDPNGITEKNPFRYRGYYYDRETGFYYLQSRYYNPETCRFINADGVVNSGKGFVGYNLFAYCHNNPANKADPSGYWVETALDIAGLVWSIYDMCTEPSWENAGWLALDIVCIAVPILTGSYAVKAASKGTAKLLNASADVAKYSDDVIEGVGSVGKGFNTFNDAKKFLGSPGEGKQWHHIVEQSQINKSGFSATQIQNTNNLIAIDKATHAKISGYYNSIDAGLSDTMRVRDWLAGQSFETQYQFGMDVLKRFGVTK